MKDTKMVSLEMPVVMSEAVRQFAFNRHLSFSAALRYIIADYLKLADEEQPTDSLGNS